MQRSLSLAIAVPAIALFLGAGADPAFSAPISASEPKPVNTALSDTNRPATLVACVRAPMAKGNKAQQIRFAPGKDSATLKSAVVRGTQNTYLINAKKGQRMTLKISSLESNAVFALITPLNPSGKRQTLKSEVMSWSNVLPESGDYTIVVSPTRGNATYQLDVTIR